MLFYGGTLANPIMLTTAAIASAVSFVMAGRLNHAYIDSLERSLEQHAIDLDLPDADESPARPMWPVTAGLPITRSLSGQNGTPPPWMRESVAQQWLDLSSGEPERIKRALKHGPPLERPLLPWVIPLLARRSVAPFAHEALEAVAVHNVGQLADYLLDPSTPVKVRRAVPAILAATANERAANALLYALQDDVFEVRLETSRALDNLKRSSDIHVEAEEIFAAIRRELIQRVEPPNLDLVFSLMGVVLPREPVRAAFEGLTTKDPQLRGLALEYLDSALPPDIGEALLRLVDTDHEPPEESAIDDLRQELTKLIQQIRERRS
jgi:hypothetical protein